MYTGLHVQYPLFFSDFKGTGIFLDRFLEKHSNIKFYEHPSSGSRVVSCGRTDVKKFAVASLGRSTLEFEANNLRRNNGRTSPRDAALQPRKKELKTSKCASLDDLIAKSCSDFSLPRFDPVHL
jgi:hypothetical protein